jgi:hypothetical protein
MKAHEILQQDNFNPSSTELLKLSLSSIVNFTNPEIQDKSFITADKLNDLNHTRQLEKNALKLDSTTEKLIDKSDASTHWR